MGMRKPPGRRLLRSSKQVIVPRWQQKPMFMLTRTRVKWCSMHISASACSKRVFSIALNLFRNREEKRFLKSPPPSDECADNRHFCYSSNNLACFCQITGSVTPLCAFHTQSCASPPCPLQRSHLQCCNGDRRNSFLRDLLLLLLSGEREKVAELVLLQIAARAPFVGDQGLQDHLAHPIFSG